MAPTPVVFLVTGMFDFRESHPTPAVVYAHIVNNAIVSWVNLHSGVLTDNSTFPHPKYDAFDYVGVIEPRFALNVHRSFLRDAERGDISAWRQSFELWYLTSFERVSINAVSYFGRDIAAHYNATLFTSLTLDEEDWLSVQLPKRTQRPSLIYGAAVCAHFAFEEQREDLDKSDLLARYAALVP